MGFPTVQQKGNRRAVNVLSFRSILAISNRRCSTGDTRGRCSATFHEFRKGEYEGTQAKCTSFIFDSQQRGESQCVPRAKS